MEVFAWPAAAAFLGSVGLFLLRAPLTRLIDRIRHISKDGVKADASLLQSSAVAEANEKGENFSATKQIQQQSDNSLFAQVEARIRGQFEGHLNKDAKEREDQLFRILAAAVVAREFELTYSLIWGSQLEALVTLNTAGASGMIPGQLFPIYERAQANYPDAYQGGTFELWLGFLVNRQLIARKDPVVHITLAGREFLKFIVDNGKEAYKNL